MKIPSPVGQVYTGNLTPPVAAIDPTRADPYAWLREKNNPAVLAYLTAENAYTAAVMQPEQALQEQLYREMLSRIQETDLSVPVRQGDYLYYTRTEQGAASIPSTAASASVWKRTRNCCWTPTHWPKARSTSGSASSSQVRTTNFWHTLPISTATKSTPSVSKICAPGELLGRFHRGRQHASLAWANDNRTFFYTTVDEAKRPYKVFRHSPGRSRRCAGAPRG